MGTTSQATIQDENLIPIDSRFKLPKKFTHLRKDQLKVAELAKDYFDSGVDVVIIEAPVGFGKSIAVELVRQLLKSRMVYVAPHIQLQEQMVEQLPYSTMIKGRQNYPHGGIGGASKFPRETCADCFKKSLCGESGCEYKEAKANFEAASVGVTNFSFWLSAANYLNMFRPNSLTEVQQKNLRPNSWPSRWIDDYLTVFDEACTVKKMLLDHLDVHVSLGSLEKIGKEAGISLKVPKPPTYDFSTWPCWWMDVREFVNKALREYGNPDAKDIRSVRWVARVAKLKLALEQVEVDWIYDPLRAKNSNGRKNGEAYAVNLKPIAVGELGKVKLWDHCGKTIATSGTIINSDIWAEETGLDKSGKSYEFIQVDSKWDKWRRTIHRVPGLEVSKIHKFARWNKQPFWEKLIGDIVWILSKYPDERTIIHSVSHELAEDIGGELKGFFGDRIIVHQKPREFGKLSYWDDRESGEGVNGGDDLELFGVEARIEVKKDSSLKRYLAREGSVLVSASITRGVNLSDDDCRNIIEPKVPWGNLGDRRIQAMLSNGGRGQLNYYVEACREIVQACGRAMRHEFDWCRIWVLDDTFDRIVDCRGLLPKYFQDSIRPKEDYMSRF